MKISVSSLLACAALAATQSLDAQGTAFTYQGRLNSSGTPTSGLYDFRFRLDADPAGNTILGTVLTNAIPVTNGLFTTTIDFGPGWFNGSNYWLEVDVRTNTGSNGSYTVLNPFQPLTPAPYAVFANTASNVSGAISAAQLSGPVGSANLSGTYGNAVALNNPGNSFTGNGGGLTNLAAASLVGALPAISGASLTTLNASQLTSIGDTNGGSGNFFLGSAGNSYTSGSDNTGTGLQALSTITSGRDNTANGWQADYFNGSGSGNTAVGSAALEYNMNGSYNTAIGAATFSGGFSFGGSNNIALGYQAGYNLISGNSDIYIGNSGFNGENNIIRIGTPGVHTNTFIAGVINGNGGGLTNLNVSASQLTSIGNTNGGHGNYYIGLSGNSQTSGSDNTADGFQSLDVASSGSDNTANGWSSLYLNASGSGNTADGSGALEYNESGSYNTAIGASTLSVVGFGGSNNIALGYQAGLSLNANQSGNIDIGNQGAVSDNNIIRIGTGQTQTYLAGIINGNGAGLTNLNVSASQLISIGNTNGSAQGNFFIGPSGNSFASGVNNTANGSQSLAFIFSGSFNTANGTGALGYDSSGSYNTAIGASTISGIGFHGSNNIALGYNAGSSYTGGESGNIDIGNLGTVGENNTIRIGSSQTQTFIAGTISGNGGGLTSLNAANLSGALPAISGASLTSLNASQLTSGAVPSARLSGTYSSLITFNNTGNSYVGSMQVGGSGTMFTTVQAGQAIMPSSTTVQTNFTVTFPQAFSSAPKVIASISGDPGFPTASDTFAMSIRAITTTTGFTVNVMRVDTAGGWSQQLRINWQAWQ